MSLQTTLKGCYEVLRESAKQHRQSDDPAHAAMCDLQADGVLHYLEDVECYHSPARKETSG
jgi:hypothetical protein